MATQTNGTDQPFKVLNVFLWIIQFILGAMFIMAAFMKLATPIEELSKQIPWVAQVPVALVRFIGLCDLLGAIGLLVPALTRIKPQLVPLAALGIVLIMILAILFHVSRRETSVIGFNFILIVLALFVAWGRFKKVPIQPK